MSATQAEIQMSRSRSLPQVWATLFFGLAAVFPIGAWIIFLFAGIPQAQSTIDAAAAQLQFIFSNESPARWWFVGWASLPFILVALALCSMSPMSHKKSVALAVFLASLAASTVSMVFYDLFFAALVAAGSISAFIRYQRLAT